MAKVYELVDEELYKFLLLYKETNTIARLPGSGRKNIIKVLRRSWEPMIQ